MLLAVAMLGAVVPATARAQVVINEFLPDAAGGDSGYEWVELLNTGSASVDVAGWSIRKATSGDYGLVYTIPSDTPRSLAAGEYLVIGGWLVGGADLSTEVDDPLGLGNGTGGDGIRLADDQGSTVDTIVYGGVNDDGIEGDDGAGTTSVAPDPPEDSSLARSPDGVDTDRSGDDVIIATPTMGAANPDPPACDLASDIVINEILPDPVGGDTGLEYLELYSGAGRTVSLEGWSIEAGTSSFGVDVVLGDVSIDDEGFLLIGEDQVTGADLTASLSLGNASDADAVRLVDCDGQVADTVVYGSPNDDGWVDDTGGEATSLAPAPGSGQALARRIDGADSDQSADDFAVVDTQTPGGPNPVPPVCEAEAGWVVINEFLPNPEGSDTEAQAEWIELYNAHATDTIELDGWTLGAASREDSYSIKFTFPSTASIPAGGHLLIGEANVSGADWVPAGSLSLGNGTGGDGVRLVDCEGNPADTVVYGDSNEDEVIDDSGVAATSVASTPGDGASLARKTDGLDTDASGADFTVSSDPTPGAANPTFVCFPSEGDVVVNEFLPDPEGSDTEAMAEWVELYNRGDDEVRLDGWQILAVSNGEDGTVDVILPPDTVLAPESFLVVGNVNVAEADVVTTFSIGNGSGGDAVILGDCEGTVVDVIAYGDTNDDGLLDEDGGPAEVAPAPGSAQSLARSEDGLDTDDPGDWFIDVSPSPGQSNFDPGPDDTGGDEPSRGCGGDGAPDSDAPEAGCGSERTPGDGGCATAPLPFGGLELVPLVVALLRRRR